MKHPLVSSVPSSPTPKKQRNCVVSPASPLPHNIPTENSANFAAPQQVGLDCTNGQLLGKYARRDARLLRRLGWEKFIRYLQHSSDLTTNLHQVPHAATPYLARLSKCGVLAPSMSPSWTHNHCVNVFKRGPHVSASKLYRDFLHQDMVDYVNKKFWCVLPFSAVKHYPHLKLAPCGVVPQWDRRPRPIMDYTYTSVNQMSVPLALMHSMQIGKTLPRILQRLAYANTSFGPPAMLKFDLSDRYYRIRLSLEAALELAVILPGARPDQHLVGIPLSLPMGWAYSPPYFCSFTETAADVANEALSTQQPPTYQHPIECQSQQSMATVPLHIYQQFHWNSTTSTPTYHPPSYCARHLEHF